jgi:ribonuclease HII
VKHPNLKEEKKLWKKGFKRVAGLDEAGRGPLAGPVVAAAVMIKIPKSKFLIFKQFLNPNFQNLKRFNYPNLFKNSDLGLRILLNEVRDSKKLSPQKREHLYEILTHCPYIEWGIGKVSEKVIDKINILEATKLAMKKAIDNLKPDFLILDGNFKINSQIPQKPIIKADQKVFSSSAASIIAKVTRDRIMENYHKKYLKYGFKKHKGYPTKFHFLALKKYGPCEIHRKSFRPVAECKTRAQK